MSQATISENVQTLRQQIIYASTLAKSLSFELAKQVGEEEGYLFENAKELASLLLRIIEGLELNLELEYEPELVNILKLEQSSQSNVEHEVRRIRQRIIETVQISAAITDMLKYVEGAKAIENPWAVIDEIDRLCRNLSTRARVIPYPRWEYNYRYYPISSTLLRISELANAQDSRINAALTRLLADSPYYFSLQFPPTSKPNLLQMAMWGHELGHFMDNIEGMKLFNLESPFEYQVLYISQQRAEAVVKNAFPDEIIRDLIDKTRKKMDEAEIVEVLEKYNERIGKLIFRWAREVFADLYSIHLFGPSAIFSLVEFVRPLTVGKIKTIDSLYPPFDVRLDLIIREYEKWLSTSPEIEKLIETSNPEDALGVLKAEIDRLKNLDSETADALDEDENISFEENIPSAEEDYFDLIYPYMIDMLNLVVKDFSRYIHTLKQDHSECYLRPEDFISIGKSIRDLELGIPPDLIPDPFDPLHRHLRVRILPLIINSGWLYWIKIQRQITDKVLMQQNFEKINNSLLKAVEESSALQWFSETSRFTESDPSDRDQENRSFSSALSKVQPGSYPYSGVLRKDDIFAEMSTGKLLIRPLISPNSQIHETSIDIRLGNEFKIMKRSAITKQDPIQILREPSFIDHQSKYFVPFGKPFVLHPWQFISATCLEFLKIPDSCIGWVANRKSWTKLGLVYVGSEDLSPSFSGQIVLELTNFGNAPILLYPGSRICSLYLIPINSGSIAN